MINNEVIAKGIHTHIITLSQVELFKPSCKDNATKYLATRLENVVVWCKGNPYQGNDGAFTTYINQK